MATDKLTDTNLPLYSLTIAEFIELNKKIFAELSCNQPPPAIESPEEILDIKQTAKLINLSVPSIYTLTSERNIPFMKLSKKLYFKKSELIQWLESGRRKTKKEIKNEAAQYVNKNKRRSL